MSAIDIHLKTLAIIHLPVFLLAVDGEEVRFAGLNPAHERATGMTASGVAGKTPHQLLPPRSADTIMENYLTCIRTKQPMTYEELLELPSGRLWWETTLSPILEDNTVTGIIGLATNITARKLIEEQLSDAVQEIGDVRDQYHALALTTAHDLRGPLRQVQVVNELIQDGFKDLGDNKVELLETSDNIIEKSIELIEARLEAVWSTKHSTFGVAEVNLKHWCMDAIAIIDPMAKLDFETPEAMIECERFMIDICLRNLLENAAKHAKSAVSLDVDIDYSKLKFTIRDDGPGFDPIAFPPGPCPIPEASTDSRNGYGLASVVRLVKARDGEVSIERPTDEMAGGAISFTLKGSFVT